MFCSFRAFRTRPCNNSRQCQMWYVVLRAKLLPPLNIHKSKQTRRNICLSRILRSHSFRLSARQFLCHRFHSSPQSVRLWYELKTLHVSRIKLPNSQFIDFELKFYICSNSFTRCISLSIFPRSWFSIDQQQQQQQQQP